MATRTAKRQCTTCNVQRGIFKCDGCSDLFCSTHTIQHHQTILKKLEAIEEIRDSVQKTLMEKSNVPRADVHNLCDQLMKTINDWEEQSILKIHQVAEEIRIQQISDELKQSRKNEDFIEPDLVAWQNKLNRLREELINPPEIIIRQDYTKIISNINVHILYTQELFECSSGNADFEENNQVVYLKTGPDIYIEVRGRCEYKDGQHTITMKIEELTGWILFGIVSQSTSLQIHSYNSLSCYGWYNSQNFNYAAGQNVYGPGNDAMQNDIIHLFIDCDAKLIRLTNERVNKTLEFQVDIEKCPFPWKLHLNLNIAPTRIRIISSTKS